ncbi:long-chain-alcohol oxidase FAO4A-like [Papaver somniferum]|uniref:long-chain-alcohol oxidase FAO4A-like n=1 Tax=Papaver somniferum TaxID=3469 RepID=UPI000E6FE9B6|nr:long-chain-alcohol oxidase FAO4A-like [Papaver somniferum]
MKASYSRMMPMILKIASSLPLSLSSRQMESLSAISDTFLPSIDLCNTTNNNISTHDDNDSIHNFYKTSASMAKTPQNVGLAITEKFAHPALGMLRFALWMLSTNIGTLIFCGRLSLKKEFPYLQKFSEVTPEIREEILREWSMNYFYVLRMLFNSTKYLTLLFFFTQIDENNENQSWKAMYCGPDPEFLKHTKEPSGGNNKKDCIDDGDEKNLFGPLYRGIVCPKHCLTETLKQSGFLFHIHDSSSRAVTIPCDVVIIGSGSGGGVVAGVLAKSGYKVIVLEKGDYFARSTLSLLEGPSMSQMYQGSGLLATEDLGVVLLAGSTVGGGSTVNWSASIRTPQHVMNEWCSRHELELFNSKLYREAMDAVCDRMGVQSCAHEEGFNNVVLRKGCLEMGYPVNDIPRNSTPDHYCGWCNFGCKDGKKKGTAETWLVDMMDSGNGLILPRCEAKKILYERKKGRKRDTATGVAFEFDNGHQKEVHEVQAKVVVVAGGAMGTPVLFKKSGLKNPNIGKHLHLHPVAMAWGYFPPETPLLSDVWPVNEKRSYEGGIMTAMSTVVADFNKTGYGAVIQTPALHPGMFAALTPWVSGVDFRERMCKFSRTAHIFALARDEGSGEVKSMNTLWYKMDQRDEQKLKRGTEKMLRILVAAGDEEIGTHHCEGKRLKVKGVSWHELQRFIKDESEKGVTELVRPISSAHQMGSCRMGVEASESVVDQRGETWEVEGLYVADSSVFPTALGVNPMVTVQAIAYCTAHSILEVLGRKQERYLY